MPTKSTALTVAAAVVTLSLIVVLLVPMLKELGITKRTDTDYLRMFKQVVGIVHKSYVDDVDQKKLLTGAINGMLASLDPHSQYLPATDYKEMKVHMAGEFGGLGIELEMREGKLMVNSPIEDTPAFKAGILPGDYIWKIDNKPTQGLNITECVSRMRGTPGTNVTLGIVRAGSTPLTFHLTRAIIKTKSLKAKLLEPGYGYVGISEFQERTGEDFRKALKTLAADNGAPLSGLILDLRFNPGGLVDQAFRVADCFIGENIKAEALIVSMKGRDPSTQRSLSAYVGDKEPNYPMVVLINGGSASASEIVAGALQDHKRAVIMGTQSFGKGSVQSVITLKNGDGLKLTTARYYTPSGRSIQAKGITPDITVEINRKPKAAAPDKNDEIHEEDLNGHLETPKTKDPNDPHKGLAPKGGVIPDPHQPKVPLPATPRASNKSLQEATEQELLAKDNQLSRALDLLKGVNILKTSARR